MRTKKQELISEELKPLVSKMLKEYREKYTHTLGNLTMTGYNSNLGNKSFDEKKNRKNSEGNDIGYMNGLYLNSKLAEIDEWKITDIKNRTDDLVKLSMKLFSL